MQLESGPCRVQIKLFFCLAESQNSFNLFPWENGRVSGILLVLLGEENTFSLMEIPFLYSIKLPHLPPQQKYEVKVIRSKSFYGTGESGHFTIVIVRSFLQTINGGTLMTEISANKPCAIFNTGL